MACLVHQGALNLYNMSAHRGMVQISCLKPFWLSKLAEVAAAAGDDIGWLTPEPLLQMQFCAPMHAGHFCGLVLNGLGPGTGRKWRVADPWYS